MTNIEPIAAIAQRSPHDLAMDDSSYEKASAPEVGVSSNLSRSPRRPVQPPDRDREMSSRKEERDVAAVGEATDRSGGPLHRHPRSSVSESRQDDERRRAPSERQERHAHATGQHTIEEVRSAVFRGILAIRK